MCPYDRTPSMGVAVEMFKITVSGCTVNVLNYVNLSHGPSLHGTSRFVCLLRCPYCGVLVTKVTAVFTMRMCRMPEAMPEFGSI